MRRFQRAIERERLASTFLFIGAPGIGKRSFALKLAQTLQCENVPPAQMSPCGTCLSCRQAMEGTHPDILFVSRPADRAFIPIELLIGPKENRMREGLCAELATTPFFKKRKIAIIDDADYLNVEGANAMLKTLEEPPRKSVLILIGTSAAKQLPTIRSRCQMIRFAPLASSVVETILRQKIDSQEEKGAKSRSRRAPVGVPTEEMIPLLTAYSNGSVEEALALADESLWEFRRVFLRTLAEAPRERTNWAKTIEAHLDEVGKVPALRRARLGLIMEFAADFYRRLAIYLAGSPIRDPQMDAEWQPILTEAAKNWKFDADAAAQAATRVVDWMELLQRNVHQPSLIDAWLDDLLLIHQGDARRLGPLPWTI